MKGLYDISVMFKIFKRFEKVVLDFKFKKKWGKNGQKWAKMGKNGCPRPRNYTLLVSILGFIDGLMFSYKPAHSCDE